MDKYIIYRKEKFINPLRDYHGLTWRTLIDQPVTLAGCCGSTRHVHARVHDLADVAYFLLYLHLYYRKNVHIILSRSFKRQ